MTKRPLALITGGTSGLGLGAAMALLVDHDLAFAAAPAIRHRRNWKFAIATTSLFEHVCDLGGAAEVATSSCKHEGESWCDLRDTAEVAT